MAAAEAEVEEAAVLPLPQSVQEARAVPAAVPAVCKAPTTMVTSKVPEVEAEAAAGPTAEAAEAEAPNAPRQRMATTTNPKAVQVVPAALRDEKEMQLSGTQTGTSGHAWTTRLRVLAAQVAVVWKRDEWKSYVVTSTFQTKQKWFTNLSASGGAGGQEKDSDSYDGGNGGAGGKATSKTEWNTAGNLILSTAANLNLSSSTGYAYGRRVMGVQRPQGRWHKCE